MDRQLSTWVDEVRRFNRRLHLVSPSMEKNLEEQVRDTMEVLAGIREDEICDLGSGSGFLGIPYRIMNPGARVVLLERSGKKCLFLRHVIDKLGLEGLEVLEADPVKTAVGPFFALMSRSFSPKETLIRAVLRSSATPGRFYYIQTGEPEEVSDANLTLQERITRPYRDYRLNLDVYLVTSR